MSTSGYLENVTAEFRRLKTLADDAIRQVDTGGFFTALDPDSNSLAVIVKHIAGNLRSRWTDFLRADGEKSDRNRDDEFVLTGEETRDTVLNRWETSWQLVFATLESLRPEDLDRTITIRSEPYRVLAAINRQLTHNAYHVGQIVFLAKHLLGDKWRNLSVPKGKSEDFNAEMKRRYQ